MRTAVDHRETILLAAAKMFADNKFHEVTMDNVAEKAGISKGTIYRYFPDKEELFVALSVRYLNLFGTEIKTIADTERPPLVRLHNMLIRASEMIHEHLDFFRVMVRYESELNTQSQSDFEARRDSIRHSFANVVREAQARGEIDAEFDAMIAANMLLGMMRNLLRFQVPMPSPEKTAEYVMRVFVHGLKTQKGGAA